MVKKKFENIFIRFGATHERDRQTDGQTGRHRMPAIAALMHSIARKKKLLSNVIEHPSLKIRRWSPGYNGFAVNVRNIS